MRILTPTFILLCCFVAPLAGIAQQAYKPGYVVLSNNDTLSGFLKVQSSRKATQKASFRKEIKGSEEAYTPDQIKAYRYDNGKYYISHSVTLKNTQKQVFLECMIKGKASIYYANNDGDDHYYIQKEAEELIELTEPKTYTKINGKLYVTPPRYKNKLGILLSDADVQSNIQKTSLEYKSLVALAKVYNEKASGTETYEMYAPQKKVIRDYTVFAGYSISRYNFAFDFATDFAGGIQAGFIANFKGIFFSNEKLGLSIGALLEKDISDTQLKPYGSNQGLGREVNLDVTSLRIPFTINYYQPVKNSTFIIGLGVSNRITLSKNENFKIVEGKESIPNYFLGTTVFVGYEIKVSPSNKLTFNLAGDHVTNFDWLVKITQFTARVGFTF